MTKPAIERLREVVESGYPGGTRHARSLTARRALLNAIVAEGERERLARVIAPHLFPLTPLDGPAVQQHQRQALAKADAILEHFAAMALGEE